jgi:hypothetical protein
MFDLLKEKWIPVVLAVVLGLTGGGASFFFTDAHDSKCDRMGSDIKLWTIEYLDSHMPPKEIVQRLKNIDRILDGMQETLKENSAKINQLYYNKMEAHETGHPSTLISERVSR